LTLEELSRARTYVRAYGDSNLCW